MLVEKITVEKSSNFSTKFVTIFIRYFFFNVIWKIYLVGFLRCREIVFFASRETLRKWETKCLEKNCETYSLIMRTDSHFSRLIFLLTRFYGNVRSCYIRKFQTTLWRIRNVLYGEYFFIISIREVSEFRRLERDTLGAAFL